MNYSGFEKIFIKIFWFVENNLNLYYKIKINMNPKLEQLKAATEQALVEGASFYEKGNSAAGTRLRKELKTIADLAKELRKDVSEVKNERKESK